MKMKRLDNRKIPLKETGRVSCGTLRKQDLIPRFAARLKELHPDFHDAMVTFLGWRPGLPEEAEYWNTPRARDDLDTLTESLEVLSPEGFYFFEHPDRPADFGFWPSELLSRDMED